MKIYGDPEKVARIIVDREKSSAKNVVDDAYKASLKLVEDAYKKAVAQGLRRVEDEYQRLEELLSSKRSSLELELRNRIAEVKSKYINEVLSRALDEIARMKGEEWYKRFMETVLRKIVDEAAGQEKVIVKVAGDDIDLARTILEKLAPGNVELSNEPAPIRGGAIGESEDGSLRLDYSLDLLVAMNESRLRLIASKALFG